VSDRLEELRRQRALQREHLDWLDREIAALEGSSSPAPGASPLPIQPRPPVDDRDAESILEEFRQQPASIERRTKLGCIIYFLIAVGLLAIAVTVVYLHQRARRGY
jgi:hypothetical protein